ncbi:MAG: hypothetical protein HYW48_11945 [Deltaproteobacteria bacterium]|nr:hypothetical protein [Deltaproteobacteria bacterium]
MPENKTQDESFCFEGKTVAYSNSAGLFSATKTAGCVTSVSNAVTDFISSLGNINASNIVQEYDGLKQFMSDTFRIKFDAETREWIGQVRNEDLAQIFKIKSKEIISDQKGAYQVTAFARADFYMAGQYLGNEEQVVEMQLRLVPPDRKKRWYLEITSLTWSKLEKFQKRSDYQNLTK